MSSSSHASSPPRRAAPPRLRSLRPADREPLLTLLRATGSFDPAEVEVALELIDLGRADPPDAHYRFLVADDPDTGQVLGYACWGHAPMTEGVYDLYWIAVDPAAQGRGVGRALMAAAEERVRAEGGRMVLVETASKPSYAATRAFYEAIGYREEARVRDFYRVGDDKVIYARSWG